MHQPRHGHWLVALRVLKYLKVAPRQGIFLPSNCNLQLHAYYDSNWAGCPLTRCSLTVLAHPLKLNIAPWQLLPFPLAHLYYDNCAALHILANPVHHEHTKHIEVYCHFIWDCIKTGSITTSHVSSNHQLADIFTKAFGSFQLSFLVGKLGIRNLHAST
ncbi:Integrase, catalytic core [Gossypium australe]|uniref:Integrase, catalytic core n=1 Tax=Gossypium australe TaxID=47621 RepID=A0A5B6WQ24_9ROSI|nr:Integrase, catalytic core [Gossypium australe]